MSLIDWWKRSSAKAGEDYEKLRFDADEISDLRRGVLSESIKEKLRQRLKFVGKIDKGIALGCGVPAGCFGLIILLSFGFLVVRSIFRGINPVTVGFTLFFSVFVLIFVGLSLSGLRAYLAMKKAVADDLNGNKIGIEQGLVNAIVERSRESFAIKYKMNDTEYPVIRDVIGSEIHHHFWGGNNLTGKTTYQTREFYKFYFLPKSKMLLFYEQI